MNRILIVDDEKNILFTLTGFLNGEGYETATASTLAGAKAELRRFRPDAVVLDVYLSGENGLDLLPEFAGEGNRTPVIVVSGHADIATAVDAVRKGAYHFLEKPIDPETLGVTLANALRFAGLARKSDRLKEGWIAENFYIGESPAFQSLLQTAQRAAGSDLSVLITGENGSGKEPLAYYLYLNSGRAEGPWIAVNTAAIPEELFESELFGHRKGSFTGATRDHAGYFRQAQGGTLFLDEVAEIPLRLQAKLLRAIENRKIQAVGAEEPEAVNIRLIAATNRDLDAEIRAGRFREDLYYRLAQVPLRVPSLSERSADIPGLLRFFLRTIAEKTGSPARDFTLAALERLQNRVFRGNIRELRNLVERLVLFSRASDTVGIEDIERIDAFATAPTTLRSDPLLETTSLREARRRWEREFLRVQLTKYGFSIKNTAQALGLLPNNLSRRLSELDLETEKCSDS